jgi:NAD(P)-dependent dehydrogenase (short-subunit alcohol dehydrogenase family)
MSGGRLDGRVAIVTGASRGIGEGVARLFAREGAAVAVVARTEQVFDERLPGTIHETVAAIEAEGGRAVAIRADLGNDDDVERIVDDARGALGPVDLLINNAALTVPGRPPAKGDTPRAAKDAPPPTRTTTTRPGSFLGFPLKGYRLHFQIGLFASYRLMQLVLPDMIELGRGGIVNISSLAAFIPGPGPYEHPGGPTVLAYGGNKSAMHHLTQAVAFEMAPHGIAVNALLPSEPVETPGNRIAYSGADFASVDDFAEATLRVAVADPSVMTGQVLWSEDVLHPELGTRGWLRS